MEVLHDQKQIKLLYVVTKNVELLLFAILSTWISTSMSDCISNSWYKSMGITLVRISVNIDSVINVICSYLQYPFNKKYYDQYCICFK